MAPKAKAKAAPKAGGGEMRRVRRRPAALVLRRPAGALGEAPPGRGVQAVWARGGIVPLHQLDPREVRQCRKIVIEEGYYYHQQVKVAGLVTEVVLLEESFSLKMRLTGTTSENVLKYNTGHPQEEFRVHACPPACNHEEVSDTLLHAVKVRQGKDKDGEEAWVSNLEVEPRECEPADELSALRARAGLGGEGEQPGAEVEKDKGRSPSRPKKKKSDKKAKKEKKVREDKREPLEKKKKRGRSSDDSSRRGAAVAMDGSNAKQAGQKAVRKLFSGTGLDPSDRVRNKVARRARKHLRKRAEKSSSGSSGSSSSSSSTGFGDRAEESIFEAASKVRIIAEKFPGALGNQTLNQMRATLLQEVGFEDRTNVLYPAAVAYFRQHLHKKASGPTQRELLTLAHAVDLLIRGKVASSVDTMVQRIKSIEQTLTGSHWSVSQRLEVLPADTTTLTAVQESAAAQRELYAESKTKWFASFPEGRPNKGGKNQGKGKGEGKEKPGVAADRDRKGKNQGSKGEANKKDK